MTRERTWRSGARFYKRVSGPAEAGRLIAWAHQIAEAGGTTPVPEYCPGRGALAFPIIDGKTGVALLDDVALPRLLSPLRSVRRARIADLLPHNPFIKVTARLRPDTPSWLTSRIEYLESRPLRGSEVVHGDFHCGQVIQDEAGCLWLVDLEDMARGSVEVDLGNFAAHLATRPETRQENLSESVRYWTSRVREAWDRLGEPCDPALFWRAVDIALIRRALKLCGDRGEPEVLESLEASPLFSRQTEL